MNKFMKINIQRFDGEGTLTVSFNNNTGSGTMTDITFEYSTGDTYLPLNTFAKTGYYFKGWNTQADGSGHSYINKDNKSHFIEQGDWNTAQASSSVTLYAQWEPDSRVSFYKVSSDYLNSVPINEGQLIFTTDTKQLYIDKDAETRTKIVDGTVGWYTETFTGTAAQTSSPYYAARWDMSTPDVRIGELYDGLTILTTVPVAGHASYGTLINVNGWGYHPLVACASTAVGTRYPVNATVIMTYNSTATGEAYWNGTNTTYTGVWQVVDYDSTNIYQFRYQSGTRSLNSNAGALYRYMLCMTDRNKQLIPFNNQSNKTTTYTKALNQTPFDPFGEILYYNTTTTISAGGDPGITSLYSRIVLDVRYSLNINSNGTAGTTALVAKKPVYIKALYNKTTGLATFKQNTSSSSYYERSSIVQELPTTNPNSGLAANTCYIYIYLGQAYTTYNMELDLNHPVYYWDDLLEVTVPFGGRDVTKTSQITNDSGFLTSYTETDPIYSASAAAGITSTDITNWNNKSTFSGNYNDLTNKPTIPTVDATLSGTSENAIQNKAVHSALANKLETSLKGANNGLAELDASGKVPSEQLPSYVDDVLEYSSQSSFPSTGETGKIYIAIDTNKTYRWSGSAYVEISASLALGETNSTAYRGDRGKTAYDHSQLTSGNPHGVTATDVGLGNVGNFKAVSTVANQGLTDTEKSNARGNIGAGTSNLVLGTTSADAYRGDRGLTAYEHATDSNRLTTAKTEALYKIATTTEGHVKSVTAVDKSDITGLGIPDSDTTYTFATGDANGQIKVTPSGGSASNINVKGLSDGAYKTVDSSISAASTSTNLPTSQAVAAFVEGKGYVTTDTNTTYSLTQDSSDGHKITLTPSSGTAQTVTIPDNDTTYTFATGSANGAISVTPSGGSAADVAVKGLSDLAYIAKGSGSSKFLREDGTWQTVSSTDTKNTAGATDTNNKIFLIGATTQDTNPQTYSHDTAYVGTDGKLYSNSKEVVNLSDSQALTNKTYNGYSLGAACAKSVDTSISAGSTSVALPTAQAVAGFVEGKGYITNTDYATNSTGGVVKVSVGDYGLNMDEGVLKGVVKTYAQYGDMSSKGVVSKGTLENVITNKKLKLTSANEGNDIDISVKVPSGYTQLEYIESTGTQWLNPDISAGANIGIDLTYAYPTISSSTNAGICGTYQGTSPRTDFMLVTTVTGKTNANLFYAHRGVESNSGITPVANTKYNVKINWLNDGFIKYGTSVVAVGENIPVTGDIHLFGRLASGSYSYGVARIYQCQFSNGEQITRNLLPARRNSDNVLGMYDIINNVFYTNQGSGTFTAGGDATPIISFKNENNYVPGEYDYIYNDNYSHGTVWNGGWTVQLGCYDNGTGGEGTGPSSNLQLYAHDSLGAALIFRNADYIATGEFKANASGATVTSVSIDNSDVTHTTALTLGGTYGNWTYRNDDTDCCSSIHISSTEVGLEYDDTNGEPTGYISINNQGTHISGLVSPTYNSDAATKGYVDSAYVALTENEIDTITGVTLVDTEGRSY